MQQDTLPAAQRRLITKAIPASASSSSSRSPTTGAKPRCRAIAAGRAMPVSTSRESGKHRRRRNGGGNPVQRHLVGGDAAVDLLDGLVRFELPQVRMRPSDADRVSFRRDPSHQSGCAGTPACRSGKVVRNGTLGRKRRQDLRRGRRPATGRRRKWSTTSWSRAQRLRKALQAHARKGDGIDDKNPRGAAERNARAVSRQRCRRQRDRERQHQARIGFLGQLTPRHL